MNNAILPKTFNIGCSDGGCVFGHRGGMCTNGGCHCLLEHYRGDPLTQRLVREGLLLLRQIADLPSIQAALAEIGYAVEERKKRDEEQKNE